MMVIVAILCLIASGVLRVHVALQLALFTFGISTFLIREKRQQHSSIQWLLIPIILFGFWLRVVNLENLVHVFVDETSFVDGILTVQDQPDLPIFTYMAPIAAFSWIYPTLQAGSIALLGETFMGVRIISVIFGTLTIPAVYLLGAWIGGKRAGLIAALMLATFPPHIHFSRTAINNIADPLFGTLAFALIYRRKYLVAGVTLALTAYFYEGGKILYPLVGVIMVMMQRPGKSAFRRFIVGFVIGSIPLWLTMLRYNMPYFPRYDDEALGAAYWADLLTDISAFNAFIQEQIIPAFGHYITHADTSAFFYGGKTAIILPFMLPFVLIGSVIYWRRVMPLLAVILLAGIGNTIIADPGWTARYVVTFPMIAVLAALGVIVLAEGAYQVGTRHLRQFAYAVSAILILAQAIYYFGVHMPYYIVQVHPQRDHQDIIWRSREFPPGTTVLLFTDELTYYLHTVTLSRLWGLDLRFQFLHPLHLTTRSNSRLPQTDGHDLAIFVQPDNLEIIAFLAQTFDLPAPQYSPYNIPRSKQYVLFYLENPALQDKSPSQN